MWCRAFLASIALTYIVCVLVLNGLQKEDLDVSTLRKLQRHNVNIDDMNNETLRKECETVTGTSARFDDNNKSDEKILTDISDKKEEQKMKLSDSNLQNIIINYFNNAQRTGKTNDSGKVMNDESKQSYELPNIENFMNVWNMLKKVKQNAIITTTKPFETSTTSLKITNRFNKRSDDTNMEYINRILDRFIAIQKTSTTIPPTTEKIAYDIIAHKIQEILTNSRNKDKLNSLVTQSTVVKEYVTDKVNQEVEVLHNDSILYIEDMTKITNPFETFRSVKDMNTSNRNLQFEDKNLSYLTKRRYLNDDVRPMKYDGNTPNENQHFKNNGEEKQMKIISDDIIREISESVKAKVLEDLKLVITTTTKNPTTKQTTLKTTVRPRKLTTENIKREENQPKMDATALLEKVMSMFQQFKTNKENAEPLIINRASEDANIRTIHNALIKITDPQISAANIYDIKPHPLDIKSVIINPYNPMNTPAILPKDPYTFLNINTQSIPSAKTEHKITQLNIFNTKNNYHTSPVKLQTNSFEIAPLGLPAQQSLVYQNIVVSTKHPLEIIKHDYSHQSYTPHYKKHSVDKNYKDMLPSYQPQQSRERHTERGIGRQESVEYINDEYYKEKKRKPIKYRDYGRTQYNDHNSQRFHEKLERTEDWPRMSRSREVIRHNDKDGTRLASRHQRPLNEAKKRTRYDDAHFRNFLNTQQKVNDMLERILATKTHANGPRSVETTV